MSDRGDELVNSIGIIFGQLLEVDSTRAHNWLQTTFDQLSGQKYTSRIAALEREIREKERECIRLKRGILIVGPEEYNKIRAEQQRS